MATKRHVVQPKTCTFACAKTIERTLDATISPSPYLQWQFTKADRRSIKNSRSREIESRVRVTDPAIYKVSAPFRFALVNDYTSFRSCFLSFRGFFAFPDQRLWNHAVVRLFFFSNPLFSLSPSCRTEKKSVVEPRSSCDVRVRLSSLARPFFRRLFNKWRSTAGNTMNRGFSRFTEKQLRTLSVDVVLTISSFLFRFGVEIYVCISCIISNF